MVHVDTGREVAALDQLDVVRSEVVTRTAVAGRGRHDARPVVATATGDRGARDYLASHDTRLVECGDLATGADVDER